MKTDSYLMNLLSILSNPIGISEFYGGCAFYITMQTWKIDLCSFSRNVGPGSSTKDIDFNVKLSIKCHFINAFFLLHWWWYYGKYKRNKSYFLQNYLSLLLMISCIIYCSYKYHSTFSIISIFYQCIHCLQIYLIV